MRALAFITLLLVACGRPVGPRTGPAIAIDICAQPPLEVQGIRIGGVEECAHDFQRVIIGEEAAVSITMTNPTPWELSIFSARFIGRDPEVYRPEGVPESVPSGLARTFEIVFAPEDPGVAQATFLLESNAQNAQEVSVRLDGTGE